MESFTPQATLARPRQQHRLHAHGCCGYRSLERSRHSRAVLLRSSFYIIVGVLSSKFIEGSSSLPTRQDPDRVPRDVEFVKCSAVQMSCLSGASCLVTCDLQTGYYCDTDDKTGYCYCSGNSGTSSSRYERCPGGLWWDPVAHVCNWDYNVNRASCPAQDRPWWTTTTGEPTTALPTACEIHPCSPYSQGCNLVEGGESDSIDGRTCMECSTGYLGDGEVCVPAPSFALASPSSGKSAKCLFFLCFFAFLLLHFLFFFFFGFFLGGWGGA